MALGIDSREVEEKVDEGRSWIVARHGFASQLTIGEGRGVNTATYSPDLSLIKTRLADSIISALKESVLQKSSSVKYISI